MAKRKTGFTRDQHFELGVRLIQAHCTLTTAFRSLSSAYRQTGREMRAAERALRALEDLRSVLDSAICRESPPDDRTFIQAYYGTSAPDDLR